MVQISNLECASLRVLNITFLYYFVFRLKIENSLFSLKVTRVFFSFFELKLVSEKLKSYHFLPPPSLFHEELREPT